MAKKIFVLAAHKPLSRSIPAAEAAQVLAEYDYDVVNGFIIEEWEVNKAALGLFDEGFNWIKRDLRKMFDCDGVCVADDFTNNDYENEVAGIAMELPWLGSSRVSYLQEWVERAVNE